MAAHRIFFFLLLLFLPTQLGFHFWPDWAMVLGRRVDYLAPTIYLTDILLFATLLFWLFESFIRIRKQESGSRKKDDLRIIPMIHDSKFLILLLGFAVVNVLMAGNWYVAGYKWLKLGEFILLGWYIVKTKPAFSFIIWHLSFGIIYSSVLAIVQFFLQHSVGGPLWWLGERTFNVDTPGIARMSWFGRELLRPYATFPHPNVLGGFLAALLPLFVARKKWHVVFVGVIALLLTFSRSAIMIGAFGILAAYLKIRVRPLMIASAAALLVLTPFLPIADESFVVRQQLNDAAIKLWQQSPLVGVGLGNFLVELPKALPPRAVYFLQPVHNIYLLMLSETGIVGLLVFSWFAFRTLKNFKFQISNFKLSLLAILVLGLIDHYPLTLQQGQLLFALLLSLAVSASGMSKKGV